MERSHPTPANSTARAQAKTVSREGEAPAEPGFAASSARQEPRPGLLKMFFDSETWEVLAGNEPTEILAPFSPGFAGEKGWG